MPVERRAFEVRGIVQGVGFRPFVHGLASRLQLSGFIVNHAQGVAIEVEGDPHVVDRFQRELIGTPPPLARIDSIDARSVTVQGSRSFRIEHSRLSGVTSLSIPPDVATCEACLRELFDPADRRFRYPFINCTACGPRLTIVTGSPYDRERTTMAAFAMCASCRAEYLDPANRRFHAEPIACAVCGPRLELRAASGERVDGDPIVIAAEAIASGRIVAIRGLGGFHLACDAGRAAAVAELRRRKRRDDKPFAVMVPTIDAARLLCRIDDRAATLLRSPVRPIALLQKRPGVDVVEAVAPETSILGVMLPYTPLHHLIMDAFSSRRDGTTCPTVVMTSGNRSDEPIAVDNADALDRLRDIADLFVLHDRSIHVRCDDSVVRQTEGSPIVIRRSRGFAPVPVPLPLACREPILAVGGQSKNTFAIGRDRLGVISHHIGDLDDLGAVQGFTRDVALYEEAFRVRPRLVAHDLHPDYASTRFALERSNATRVPVQHHHAHLAACMAEHRLDGPVIGVIWDGAGLGTDGSVWGGEFLVGEYRRAERMAHLRYVAQPAGESAAREPWRMALAHLRDAGVDEPGLLSGIDSRRRATVHRMIDRRLNSPMTSSAGRLFDAVAALCGGRAVTTYEGQAATWLEALADQARGFSRAAYPFEIDGSASPILVDTRPLIRAIAADRIAGISGAIVARRFHVTLSHIVSTVCVALRRATGLSRVVLSGGVFANALLTAEVAKIVATEGFEVYRHGIVPPGDGGLSLGQLAVAAAQER